MIVVIYPTRKLHQCVKNLEALRPEVGISPGAKDLASSSDVELKKELYRARVGIGNSDCGFNHAMTTRKIHLVSWGIPYWASLALVVGGKQYL